MIVRIMGEGQWQVEDATAGELDKLDGEVAKAVEAGDADQLTRLLGQMADLVHEHGEPLPEGDLHASDAIVPPTDLTLEEARELLDGEGLIPDLPTQS